MLGHKFARVNPFLKRFLRLPLYFIFAGIIVSMLQNTVFGQPSASDDFYVVDRPMYTDPHLNDANFDGTQMIIVQPPLFTTATINNWDPFACKTCPFIRPDVPNSSFLGFDSFTYKYVVCCGNPPGPDSNIATVSYLVIRSDDRQNAGSCRLRRYGELMPGDSLARPVNVTNGNMWLEQRDYLLSGQGEPIEINRFYNSMVQSSGHFGFGWTTKYDESLEIFPDGKMIRLNQSDGRAIYFGRPEQSQPYRSYSPDTSGSIMVNSNGTFKLTLLDGSTRDFSAAGTLISTADRNGNTTALTYNFGGALIGVTESGGRTLVMFPNENGTISRISDAEGTVADYTYYPGTTSLKSVTYPDGSGFQFEYTDIVVNNQNRTVLTAVRDALNNILETHVYDNQARALTSETHGGVEKYTFEYTFDGLARPLTIVTDANGNVQKFHHFRKYGTNLISKTEGGCTACGSTGSEVSRYEYDDRLLLTKKIDALNRVTEYSFDADRNLVQKTDSFGTQKWTYNQFGQMLTYRDQVDSQNPDPNVNTVVNTYDPNGNLLTTKDALGNITTFTYTSAGQLAIVTDPRGNITTLLHDVQGRLTRITDARNKNTNFGYDARSRLTSVTNALSQTTALEYDLNNRVKRVTFPDSNYVESGYDLAGRRTSFRNGRGNVTTFTYDPAYRLTGVTDPLNHTSTYGYDLMSQLTSLTDALGNTTNFEYDGFRRLKKVIFPPETSGATRLEELVTYDEVGNVKTRTDTGGRVTSYDYDTSNRLIKITDAALKATQFEYNPRSQLTKVKDALNQEYIFTYDPLGRVLTETRAGSTRSFVYDSVENRTLRTDYLGRKTAYEYDVLNRLTEIEYLPTPVTGGLPQPNGFPADTVTYEYDDLSRLVSAVNSVGTVALTYDNRGRLKTETDVSGRILEYSYDPNGNRTQLKLDGAVHTTYAYDVADRLTTLTDDTGQSFAYGYDIADRLISRTMPNGVATTSEYDGMSRLKRLKDDGPGGTLFDRQYSYNTANQIREIAELTQTKNFVYDNVDRLTEMTNGIANENYSYDSVGNRTASHLSANYGYQPGRFNQLVSTATATMSYDSNGNLVRKSEGSNLWRYTWDHENRLVHAATRKQNVRYKYDALGRRAERNIGNSKERTRYTYDGSDVVLDDDNSSGITKYQNGLGIDDKLKLTNSGNASYFLPDHLGSTLSLVNSSGSVTSSANYDSFGNPAGDLTSRYRFTGRENDSFTGLYHYRARTYDAKIGRFISEDPIGFAGRDVNFYGYVWNSPIKLVDPFGTDGSTTLVLGGGAAIGGSVSLAWIPPVGIAIAGGALIYGAWHAGEYIARHPSNPLSHPWVSPDVIRPPASSPVSCRVRPRPTPYSPIPPSSNPPPDEDGGDTCMRLLVLCLENPNQSGRRKAQWGGKKDCGACYRECKADGGAWPFYKCPIFEN